MMDIFNFVVWGTIFAVLIFKFFQSIRIVPTQSAYVVERLGKYHSTLKAGFHALIPFVDKVTFIVDLKEHAIEVPPQDCFTKDEVRVIVDGVIYMSVIDPERASYGVTDFQFAAVQLAQTTTRSIIGTLELDRTFEERDLISSKVVETLSAMGPTWGIQTHRYEIRNITPPQTVKNSMEKQMTAERKRKAIVAKAEGEKQSRINRSEGIKMEMVNESEGQRQSMINRAEGRAEEILKLAEATAEALSKMAEAISENKGEDALRLNLSEKYIKSLGSLKAKGTQVVMPADISDIDELLRSAGLGQK